MCWDGLDKEERGAWCIVGGRGVFMYVQYVGHVCGGGAMVVVVVVVVAVYIYKDSERIF
jgi:hypothetical protein